MIDIAASEFETLAYMGVPEVSTAIIFFAAVKCGYKVSGGKTEVISCGPPRLNFIKVSLLSQRNAVPTNASLLEQTRCSKFFHSSEMKPVIESVREAVETLEYVEVPSLEEMLDGESQPYPYSETFETAKRNPVVIIHSSGSTGKLSFGNDIVKQLRLQVFPDLSQ